MDWFERLTGFREQGYERTRGLLTIEGERLRSKVNGRDFGIGTLELKSLRDLRGRCGGDNRGGDRRLRFRNVHGDIRLLHRSAEYRGALFQVASQFNLLEMTGPEVTPERGVTIYQHDRTQGPACAIAAGAATIYRNYFVPISGQVGQTETRQLDGLADIGQALAEALGRPVESLWTMKNGYALCSQGGLQAIGDLLARGGEVERGALRDLLRIGIHSDVQVTEGEAGEGQRVSQAFCSALPVAYSPVPAPFWQAFAELVLEGAYEATLCVAALNAGRRGSNIVLLTRLGGGAFGNQAEWIDRAMRRALTLFQDFDLDVRLVNVGSPPRAMAALEEEFG